VPLLIYVYVQVSVQRLSVRGVVPGIVGSLVQFSVLSNVVTAKALPGVISIYPTPPEAACHAFVPIVGDAKVPLTALNGEAVG